METLSQFALLAILVVGAPTIGIIIIANLARLISGENIDLRGEVVDVGRHLSGSGNPPGRVATK